MEMFSSSCMTVCAFYSGFSGYLVFPQAYHPLFVLIAGLC